MLETQQKRKRAPAFHFDVSPDDLGNDQLKKKAKSAASASAEFKPPSHSGAQPSRGTVASPSGKVQWQETWVPGWLRLQDRRRSKSRLTHVFFLFFFAVMFAPGLAHSPLTRLQLYALKGLYIFDQAFISVFACCAFRVVFLLSSVHNCFLALECASLAH